MNVFHKSIFYMLSRYGYQEGDDKEWNCFRMYFGEGEISLPDESIDVNVITAYDDNHIIINWNEGEGAADMAEWPEELQEALCNEVAKEVVKDENFLAYIHSLKISREQVLQGAKKDHEKPMGYLLTYLRDMTGMGKKALWNTAENILKDLDIQS